jgi:hypothetical protein
MAEEKEDYFDLIVELFQKYDEDNSKTISAEELAGLVYDLGVFMTPVEIDGLCVLPIHLCFNISLVFFRTLSISLGLSRTDPIPVRSSACSRTLELSRALSVSFALPVHSAFVFRAVLSFPPLLFPCSLHSFSPTL